MVDTVVKSLEVRKARLVELSRLRREDEQGAHFPRITKEEALEVFVTSVELGHRVEVTWSIDPLISVECDERFLDIFFTVESDLHISVFGIPSTVVFLREVGEELKRRNIPIPAPKCE